MENCSLTFGSAPCTASGTKCYNTFTTCKDKSNYDPQNRVYKFTSSAVKAPFDDARPYVADVQLLPTEIKDTITVRGRVFVEFIDEPDYDVGIDPYLADRAHATLTSAPGTFWRKFLARNPNYKGRIIWIYEGFEGLVEADYVKKFTGVISNISYSGNRVRIEATDLLQSLSDIQVPKPTQAKLLSDLDASLTADLGISDLTGFPSAGYARIDDEILQFTGVNTLTKQLTGVTRGKFGTTAAAHSANAKVQACRYYAPDNPYTILKDEMLNTDASISNTDIDTTAFTDILDYPGDECSFGALISKPTKLDKLFFEIVELCDAKVWLNEDNLITIRKNIPNKPGQSYTTVTEEQNILNYVTSVDMNEESRITRVSIYWDQDIIGDDEDPDSFNRVDVAIDLDAETIEYLDVINKTIYDRWHSRYIINSALVNGYINAFKNRFIINRRDAAPVIDLQLEIKDSQIKTGDFIKLTSSDIVEVDGTDTTAKPYQVISRKVQGNRLQIRAIRVNRHKFIYMAPDGTANYSSATDAEKEYGFMANANGDMGVFPLEKYVMW
jgi:hypothetical protein